MVTALEEKITAGTDALRRHAWQQAFELLSAADAAGSLDAATLEALSEAAYWSGELDCRLNAMERAYRLYLDAGNTRRAAFAAMMLARHYNDKLATSVAAGWRARAERLLEREPESPEHGYLAMWQGMAALGQGDIERMQDRAEYAVSIAERFGDRDLWALGTHMLGRALLAKDSIDEGLFLMDEATAAAVGGELSTEITGTVYCWTISTCRDLADVKRAAEWTEAAKRWCERQSVSGFPGICRIHRAEIMRLRGVWHEAELDAMAASEELPAFNPRVAGEALGELGEIRLRMGDLAGAAKAFDQALELGHEAEPGRSLLCLYQGNPAAAMTSIQQAIDEAWDRLKRAHLLPASIEIALAAGMVERASQAADDMETLAGEYGGVLFEASSLQVRGMVQLASHDPAALRSLRRALRLWQELDAPYETARVRMLLAEAQHAAGERSAATAELRAAQSAFERLGAARDARIAAEELAALDRQTAAPDEASPPQLSRAFLFTDIVSSTHLIEAIGDDAWRNLVLWHDRTLRAIFGQYGGQEVEHRGDGYFVAFPDATSALDCAIAVQRNLAEHRRNQGFAPKVRIGVHTAQAARAGSTYQGKGVHEAARIASLAEGDQILASAETLAEAGSRFSASEPRAVSLKGISRPIEVQAVRW